MESARDALLARLLEEAAAHGLTDRSLRELATAAGTSHRMLIYHFGSREGLVAAIVEAVEAAQRATLRELATVADGPADLVRRLWAQVSSPELRPFVRLFFESLAASRGSEGADRLTEPWLEESAPIADALGMATDPVAIRLGVAVTRGLLIDVVATGDAAAATESLERFVEMWEAAAPPLSP
jgi:AcrR family transcriptional regulator